MCWGYHRKGWLHAFNALQNDFEFYYLFYLSKPENELNYSGTSNILYWTDFSSAQDIINKIKPDKIVFMSVEGSNTTALNIVAKKNNIETLVVQHGMFHRYSDYLNWAKVEAEERTRTGQFSQSALEVDRFFLLRFFLRSVLLIKPLAVIYIFRLQALKQKYLEIEALKKLPSEYRMASKYVVFTKDNASIYGEKDKVESDKLIEIGNPEMDAFFNYKQKSLTKNSNYYLLVDEPWSEVKDYSSPGFGISREQTNNFYIKLADFSERQSAKLKIKLHPYSYEDDFLPSHRNIEYVRDTNVVELILQSIGVFGFSSTLMLPAIYFKKCCLFKLWETSSFQDEINELGLAQLLDYHSFNVEDIDFESVEKTDVNLQDFVKKYFYKTDGKAIERLKFILQGNNVR